jgi:hypothetical protein
MNNPTNPTAPNKGLWAKLAVNYYDNPKFDSVSPLAELLYVRSISFAKTENTGVLSLKAGARLAFDLGDHALLIQELLDAGLWSAVADGVIITNWHEWQEDSGRVEAKREQGRMNAHRRYHVLKPDASCNYCKVDGSPNGLLNGSPNGSPSGSDATDPMEEKSKRREEKSRDITLAHAPDGFDEFWLAYPRKVGIGDARKAWKSTASVRPDVSVVVAAVEAAKAGWLDPKFIPYPASWLRAHRWADNAGGAVEPVSRAVWPCRGCIGTGRQDYGADTGKEPCRDCGGSGKAEK